MNRPTFSCYISVRECRMVVLNIWRWTFKVLRNNGRAVRTMTHGGGWLVSQPVKEGGSARALLLNKDVRLVQAQGQTLKAGIPENINEHQSSAVNCHTSTPHYYEALELHHHTENSE